MPQGVRVRVPPGLLSKFASYIKENRYTAAESTGITVLIAGRLQTGCKRDARPVCRPTPPRRSVGRMVSAVSPRARWSYAGRVNLRCAVCGVHAPVVPSVDGRRAAGVLRRAGWRCHPDLRWCCPDCLAKLSSGELDATAIAEQQRATAAAIMEELLKT